MNDTIVLNSNAADAVKKSSKRPIENQDKTYEIHETVQSPMKKHKKNANLMNITHNPEDFDEDLESDKRPKLHHEIKRKEPNHENESPSKRDKKVKASKVLSNNLTKEEDEVDHDDECRQNNDTHKINETYSNVNAIALSVPAENDTKVTNTENELSVNHKTNSANKQIKASKNLLNQPTDPGSVEHHPQIAKRTAGSNFTLVRRFDSVPWEFENKEKPYNVKKCFNTENSFFGYLEIKVNEEKPFQFLPEDDMYLTLVTGKIEINIQDNITVLKEKDSFAIPRCIPYSIKNIGTVRASLVYCVGQFHLTAP